MQAREEHEVSQDSWDKINEMDNFVIKHFRVAFGNRIVSHLGKFVSAYVACGKGKMKECIEYVLRLKKLG